MPDNTELVTEPEQLFEMPDGSKMTQEQAAAMFTEHGNIKELQAASTQRDQDLATARADLETREQTLKDAQAEYDAAQTDDYQTYDDDPNAAMVARLEKLEQAETERTQQAENAKLIADMNASAETLIRKDPAFKDMEDISATRDRIVAISAWYGTPMDEVFAADQKYVGGFAPAKETEPEQNTVTEPAPAVVGGASGGNGAGVIEKKEVDFYADRDATEARMSASLDAARAGTG